ncbi:MAG TPA: hypothetical protein VFZ00_11265 [Solirubrobacter sp.]|nr:hypothetical protein [Solirubrobacter sp.]
MPAGADKGFTFDPPGAIGLVFDDARVMLKLHDPDVAVPPKDQAGALDDLLPPSGAAAPSVTGAAMGQGRAFWPSLVTCLGAKDLAGGSSLVTRDCTVMAILQWDVVGQTLAGVPGTLVCRGDGVTSAAEFVAYQLSLTVVDSAARIGSIAWSWQDIAGLAHPQTGVQFACPTGFTLLTATRRWDSPTSVTCRYYIGDQLLGEVTSSDGSIGGGVTGTFFLGAQSLGGAVIANGFAGILDEVAVFDREMCREEIEDTWLRITLYQPLGVQLYREMHDPGFPQSGEPGSDVQLENRWIGMALGFAASRFENIRRNLVPQRSYGQALTDWEAALRPTRQPNTSLDARRARVLARLRQKLGSSIPGFQGMLEGLLSGADPSQLEFLAFSNTWGDSFDTAINPLRWDTKGATWSVVTGEASLATDANQHAWPTDKFYLRRSLDGGARQAHQIVKLRFITSHANAEAGIYFGDHGRGNYFLLGLRDLGPALHLFTETFTGGISQGGATDQGDSTLVSGTTSPIWLYIHQAETFWEVSWSLTGPTSGFTPPIMVASVPPAMQWAGCYYRTVGAVGGSSTAKFDDHTLRDPYGFGPLNAWVILDQALGFHPDIPGARQVVGTVMHSYVQGGFATSPEITYGDQDNGYGQAPTGGY